MNQLKIQAQEIAEYATRIDNDYNGNPRYYISACAFMDNGEFYRPKYARKYRGKKYGAGWVFQSYDLQGDVLDCLMLREEGLK
mgnify:CR=1 FL=1|tara:strand:+ start:505 stop:753 length:249 start_codon:yes stop_codon:yes gene_type:complete